tara:strand:+ start:275 stop:814 length:540 start_codon:yes stop_codon:yes gene_type:complete
MEGLEPKKPTQEQKEAELKGMITGATQVLSNGVNVSNQLDPLAALEKRCRDEGFDLTDPGYIEYYNAVKEYLENRCTNTYGDCEVTFIYKDDVWSEEDGGEPKTVMIFVKPDEIISEIAKKCIVNIPEEDLGILIDGNIKDTKKDTLTKEQIDEGYCVLSGVKPRSKYVKIAIAGKAKE